jgi:hypothetical protein
MNDTNEVIDPELNIDLDDLDEIDNSFQPATPIVNVNQQTIKSINLLQTKVLHSDTISSNSNSNSNYNTKSIHIDPSETTVPNIVSISKIDIVAKAQDNKIESSDILQTLLSGNTKNSKHNNTIPDSNDKVNQDIQKMSLKQLKELAKHHKINSYANKTELIIALSKLANSEQV